MTYFSYSKVQKDNMGHFPCLRNLSNWSKPILQYRGKLILQKKNNNIWIMNGWGVLQGSFN